MIRKNIFYLFATTLSPKYPQALDRDEIAGTRSRRLVAPALLQIAKAARTQAFTRVQSRTLSWPITVSSERCVVSTEALK
jgi:ABC-type uncharacterized transport system involved in gliding motility auxiliary subunit